MDSATLTFHGLRLGSLRGWYVYSATRKEADRINSICAKFISREQDAMFDEWHFWKTVDKTFHVKRFTWAEIWSGSLDEVLDRFAKYYTGNH